MASFIEQYLDVDAVEDGARRRAEAERGSGPPPKGRGQRVSPGGLSRALSAAVSPVAAAPQDPATVIRLPQAAPPRTVVPGSMPTVHAPRPRRRRNAVDYVALAALLGSAFGRGERWRNVGALASGALQGRARQHQQAVAEWTREEDTWQRRNWDMARRAMAAGRRATELAVRGNAQASEEAQALVALAAALAGARPIGEALPIDAEEARALALLLARHALPRAYLGERLGAGGR